MQPAHKRYFDSATILRFGDNKLKNEVNDLIDTQFTSVAPGAIDNRFVKVHITKVSRNLISAWLSRLNLERLLR